MLTVLISGALGCGKTTLLLSLATNFRNEGRRVAILENDAGVVSVDAPFLRNRGFAVEELRSGCICCDLGAALPGAVSAIRDSIDPEILLIEPSGLAAPGIVREALKGILPREEPVVAFYLMDLMRYSLSRKPVSPFHIRAIETSDLVVSTKTRVAGAEVLDNFRTEINRTLPGIGIADSAAVSDWRYEDFLRFRSSDARQIGYPAADAVRFEEIRRFAAQYHLNWQPGTEGRTACGHLTSAVSEIRDRLVPSGFAGIGTVKLSTPAGGGTIISVSDNVSRPVVNGRTHWESPPTHLIVNVLATHDISGLEDIVRRAFGGIEALIGVEDA